MQEHDKMSQLLIDQKLINLIRNVSIKARLILSFVALAVFPLVIIGLYSYSKSSASMETEVRAFSEQLVSNLSTTVSLRLKEVEVTCTEIFQSHELKRGLWDYINHVGSDNQNKTISFMYDMLIPQLSTRFSENTNVLGISLLVNGKLIEGKGRMGPNYFDSKVDADKRERWNSMLVSADKNRTNSEWTLRSLSENEKTNNKIDHMIMCTKRVFLTNDDYFSQPPVVYVGLKENFISDIYKNTKLGNNAAEIFVINSEGLAISSTNTKELPLNKPFFEPSLLENINLSKSKNQFSFSQNLKNQEYLIAYSPIKDTDWMLVSSIPFNALKESSRQLGFEIIAVSIIIFVLSILFSLYIAYSISAPLQKLIGLMHQAKEGKLSNLVDVKEKDEIGIVMNHFSDMLSKLEKTQEQMIQNEKLAALGNMVAGITHEINTPLGVCVTATSLLQNATNNLKTGFDANQLKKSDIKKYLENTTELSRILQTSVNNAARLISSFKRVSADQSNEALVLFNLKEYLEDIVLSLKPNLKKTKHTVQIECDNGLQVLGYPGALSQMITNFIMNSLLHGFEGIEVGNIKIHAFLDGDIVTIRYLDDGKGIPKENLIKIFDPFFTTKRGAGGTGLGLNVVFQIVKNLLHGEIHCFSEPGKGVAFEVQFPKTQKAIEKHGSVAEISKYGS